MFYCYLSGLLKQGEFNELSKKYKSTSLTILTYLVKVDDPNPLEYLKTQLLK